MILIFETNCIKDTNYNKLMEVDANLEPKNNKMLNYEELMTKQPNEIIYILIQKINAQQNEISGLWNRLRKAQKKHNNY